MAKFGFDSNFLDELKSRNEIVSVIEKYIRLERKGRGFWACCPFHHEKTPSFYVNDVEQCYHCFGCREHGDVIKFVQKIESCDFIQAVEILCKNAGMDMPQLVGGENIEQKKREKEQILKCLAEAEQHYILNLYQKDAVPPQNYVKLRGFTKKELDNFGIGYSKDYNDIVTYLKSKGFSYEIMQKAGLVEKNSYGRYFDLFAGRLMFPIKNIHNECVGFSGRILDKNSVVAKYKNSPNTIVFDKSRIVFGINIVRKLKISEKINNIIIVEGQMDVIAMHRAGFTNTVACLGTAFTQEHAKQLKLLSDNVVLCLDGDNAGQKAAFRTVDILAENGFNVKVAKLENGRDPDEYIKEYGAEKLREKINDAIDYIDFKLEYKAQGINFDKPDEKNKYLRDALAILNVLKTSSEKQSYLPKVRQISGVPVEILSRDILSGNVNYTEIAEEQKTENNYEDATQKSIKFILASLLYKKDYANYNFDLLPYLKNDSFVKLYNLMKQKNANNEQIKVSMLYDEFDIDSEPNIVDIIDYNFGENGNNEQYYNACIERLQEDGIKDQLAELTQKFKSSADSAERKNIAIKISELTKKLKK